MIPLRDNITSKTKPFVNWLLIFANCYFFYIELRCRNPVALDRLIANWAIIPSVLWSDLFHQWPRLLTASFLHGGWFHLIGNMLFLFVFGSSVEDRMGHVRYLLFYLFVGMLANGVQAYAMPAAKIPLLGASGAIAGVLGAYFFYYPYARILTLIPFWIFSKMVEIPAFIFLGLWFLMQAIHGPAALSLGSKVAQDVGGVAWLAHIAGFVGGLLLGPALSKKRPKAKGSKS